MGQYIAGCAELLIKGPSGTKVSLSHAGRVNYETNSLDARNNRWFVAAVPMHHRPMQQKTPT